MIRWIKSMFAWRLVAQGAVWAYYENAVTGRRKAFKIGGGWQPIYSGWLRDGDLIVDHSGVTVVGKVPSYPPSGLQSRAHLAAREEPAHDR